MFLVSPRAATMECYSGESLWNDPVKRVQNKRGKLSPGLCVIPDLPSESAGTCIKSLPQMKVTPKKKKKERKENVFLPSLAVSCPHFRHSVVSPLVSQFFLTYDLYIAAFAGAGITLLALVSTRLRAWPLAQHNEARPP